MIAAVAERRAVGDWRGACVAADVDVPVNPDSVRRRHGADVADRVSAVLRELAPDLLRWHLPRRGHGAGELLADLVVPLAQFAGAGGRSLTLAATTPRLALDAGQRIVVALLETGKRSRHTVDGDPVIREVLAAVRVKQAQRHSLVSYPMFWSAERSAGLAAAMRDGTAHAAEITRLQDAGAFDEAWRLAGFSLSYDAGLPSRCRWLAALPVRLTGLAERVRAVLPGVESAALRSGPGAVVLSGLTSVSGLVVARAVPSHEAYGLPAVPTAAWSRSLDVDLLRCGLLDVHELHPLVASALVADPLPPPPEPDEWLYREVPFVAGSCGDADIPTLWIQCGASTHRVAYADGTWRAVDHGDPEHVAREQLFHRLGGPTNPCLQATAYLSSGRHVIELAEALLQHGRVTDVRGLLHVHAGTNVALEDLRLPAGGTVSDALAVFRENALQLRMLLAGYSPPRDITSYRTLSTTTNRRPSRKGGPARTHR
ncbi:MAG: hypothetical protein HOV83_11105 [Catenulispora sp.]|nr:hypothetical protein [Catenulispora sp.]